MKQPTKAIICAAGLGTRFLPQTKAMPKEMLPIIDKPVIQIIVEELVSAGVTDIIVVTGTTKRAIEDHFDRTDELENELREKGKIEKADELKRIAELANFVYVRQKGTPKGNARPVINASHLIDDDEPFYVMFADDFFRSSIPRAEQLRLIYEQTGKSVIALTEVDKQAASKYAVASLGEKINGKASKLTQLIEKPDPESIEMPRCFASVAGYLLTPDILPIVDSLEPDKRGELTMADAINKLAQSDDVYGCVIEGIYHDTGDPLKYLKAVVDHALVHDDYGKTFREYLVGRLNQK
jgi:UTP--glucose-1-phosphate uridylyltransferase